MIRIRVTAYGPFEEVTENVTCLVAPLLGLPHSVLEVSYRAVDDFLDGLDPDSFDALLSLGHDPRGEIIQIETVGRNVVCGRPDAMGEIQGPGPIDPKGPNQLAATLWQRPELLIETERRRPSTDAGGILCNYILYGALKRFPQKHIGFLHLPPKEKAPVAAQVDEIKAILNLALNST